MDRKTMQRIIVIILALVMLRRPLARLLRLVVFALAYAALVAKYYIFTFYWRVLEPVFVGLLFRFGFCDQCNLVAPFSHLLPPLPVRFRCRCFAALSGNLP